MMDSTLSVDMSKISIKELKRAARDAMSKDAWEYVSGVAETGYTYRRNLKAFQSLLLKQRVFHGHSTADTSTDLFGERLRSPILVAPIGSFWRISANADREVVEAAYKAGTMLFVSHAAKTPIEDFVKGPHPPMVWMGYFSRGVDKVLELAGRAKSLGYAGVGVTVDTVQPVKIGDEIPWDTETVSSRWHSATTKDIEKLRKSTPLPLVVKGVMCKEDAIIALEAGADAIVVSNHGGRITDYGRSSLEALPEVVEAVGRKATVLVDSGFRRGTDVLKALALGAKAVLIGRPICWGVAVAGAAGVQRVLDILVEELRRSMILLGVPSIDRLSEDVIIRTQPSGFNRF